MTPFEAKIFKLKSSGKTQTEAINAVLADPDVNLPPKELLATVADVYAGKVTASADDPVAITKWPGYSVKPPFFDLYGDGKQGRQEGRVVPYVRKPRGEFGYKITVGGKQVTVAWNTVAKAWLEEITALAVGNHLTSRPENGLVVGNHLTSPSPEPQKELGGWEPPYFEDVPTPLTL